MIEARSARYPWGLAVVATDDLFNDGSHPGSAEGALLVARGTAGEIVQVGHHTDANVPVYLVEFGRLVLGCLEEEIAPAGREATAEAAPAA